MTILSRRQLLTLLAALAFPIPILAKPRKQDAWTAPGFCRALEDARKQFILVHGKHLQYVHAAKFERDTILDMLGQEHKRPYLINHYYEAKWHGEVVGFSESPRLAPGILHLGEFGHVSGKQMHFCDYNMRTRTIGPLTSR